MFYNMTNSTQATTLLGMTQQINILSGYIFGFLIMLSFAIILIVAFKNFGVRTILPIVFFLTTIISWFLAIMQLIPDYVAFVLIIGTGGIVLASIFINPEG